MIRLPLPFASTHWAVVALLSGLAFAAPGVAQESAGSGAAEDIRFDSHEARYDLRLISRTPGGAIANARGSMTYRLSDTCDGWAMESKTGLDLFYAQGDAISTDWSFVSWESKDGTQYRFRVRSERDGRVHETIDGRAVLEPGSGGTAFFTAPEDKTMDLDASVMLPMQHARHVLEQARQGKHLVTAPMFDGSEPGGPMQATAVVTEAVEAGAVTELPDHVLLRDKSWRMALSFFEHGSAESMPAYEVRMRYHENGVAEEVIQDFGTMTLRAVLTELTPVTDDGC